MSRPRRWWRHHRAPVRGWRHEVFTRKRSMGTGSGSGWAEPAARSVLDRAPSRPEEPAIQGALMRSVRASHPGRDRPPPRPEAASVCAARRAGGGRLHPGGRVRRPVSGESWPERADHARDTSSARAQIVGRRGAGGAPAGAAPPRCSLPELTMAARSRSAISGEAHPPQSQPGVVVVRHGSCSSPGIPRRISAAHLPAGAGKGIPRAADLSSADARAASAAGRHAAPGRRSFPHIALRALRHGQSARQRKGAAAMGAAVGRRAAPRPWAITLHHHQGCSCAWGRPARAPRCCLDPGRARVGTC